MWPNHLHVDRDLNNLEFTLPEDAFSQVSDFLANWFLKRFMKDTKTFSIILIISVWKRARSYIRSILNSLFLRIICDKFGWHQSSGSKKEVNNVIKKVYRQTDAWQKVIRIGRLKNLIYVRGLITERYILSLGFNYHESRLSIC